MAWSFYNSSGKLIDGVLDSSITNAKMVDDAIDSDEIVAGSIDNAHMSVNSIDSDQYVDGSIDTAHMSVNSIDSDQYVDGSIDTAHIAASQITNALMADDAVGIVELSATGTASSSTFLRGDNAWAAVTIGATIVEVYRTSNESIAYATHEILDWQAAQIQLLSGSSNSTQWTSGAASKLICKSAGVYVVTAYVSWNTLASGTGEINLKMWKNRNDSGGTVGVQGASAVHNGRLGQQFTRTVNLAVDDYMEIGVYHSSNDGSSNISRTLESFSDTGTPVVRNAPFFSMYKL